MFYLTQAVHRNAQIRKNMIATVHGNRQRTWAEIKERVARFASGLHSLGIDTGDRIAILSLNSDRYFEYYFGVPWAGACVVPLNIRWSPKENAYSIKDAGVRILLVDDAFASMIPALLQEDIKLEHIIYIGDNETPKGMINYEALISKNEIIEDTFRNNDDLAGIFYTGGTTGFPKGVMLTHTNLWSSAICLLNDINLDQHARILHTAPMFHIADGAMTQAGMLAGATHVFIPMFTPQGTIETLDHQKITHTLMVPVMIQMILKEPAVRSADLSHLQYLIYGASPISEADLIQAMDTFSNANFCQGYGQTELSPLATLLTAEYHVTEGPNSGKLKSAGRAISCVEIRIADVDGKQVNTGVIGEIIVKGPNAMIGYWNKPKETATSLRNGWVHTGDAGYMDKDGFVFLVDRVKDMIVSGAENVYSVETENAVMNHHAVLQVVVIGIPSDKWGEQVHAEVILKEGHTATEAEIISKTSEYIANYKCPRSIKFRTEPFPISGAGKLLKREVRKVYWKGKDRQIG